MLQHLPNILTLFRIAIIPVVVALYYQQPNFGEYQQYSWVNFLLVALLSVVSITDYLDGYLARKLNFSSKLGAFLDPVADKLMVITSLILLVDFYQKWFITICSIIIIMREIIVSALREWMSKIGESSSVKVLNIGKIKTGVQIFAILFLFYQAPFFGLDSFAVGSILLGIATILTLYSGILYLIITIKTF